ncbi:MAG: Dna2/Cas4 domain-containing protein, partial [Prevotellaceae bacterium]|nr:Dna2/Cas4 domain-containing protein [Prevotellaceae bacterium]
PDYDREKILLFMDNLNIYYVAFTRAVKNLYIFSQTPAKTSTSLTFQQLLLNSCAISNDSGKSTENQQISRFTQDNRGSFFEKGFLSENTEQIADTRQQSENILKNQNVAVVEADFCTNRGIEKKMLFLQSNQSKEFISNEDGQANPYILQGNIMHRLFANIFTEDDVEDAVDRLIFDGIISENEREKYIADIKNALSQPAVKDWFNGNYKILNEVEILSKSDSKPLEIHRPDRVMIGGNSVIVVDYKFGVPKPSHKNQVQNYIKLLQSMNYTAVSGFIWYVNEGKIEACG